MSAIDEGIVREDFEQNLRQAIDDEKYRRARRPTTRRSIWSSITRAGCVGSGGRTFFLFSNELPYLHRAVISVKPWHTGVFSPATLKSSPEIFRFLEDNVIKKVDEFFSTETLEENGEADALGKILVLPALPTQEPFRSQSVALLKERGVTGIISFRSMLLDLVEKVEVNRNYRKSDTLEVMRILKNYDLIRDAQLDLLPHDRGAGLPSRRART